MKKSLYLAFIAALALSMGCVISNYPVITDTEGDGLNFVVNTNGKASIIPTSQIITIWPDQNEELFSMIDQKFDGVSTINTYTNVSQTGPGGTYKFQGFTYCNPDWTGCAMARAFDDNVNIFDYEIIDSCQGARSWSITASYFGRLTECGRNLMSDPGMAAAVYGNLVDMGMDRWGLPVNRQTTTLKGSDDLGHSFTMPIMGNTMLIVTEQGTAVRYSPAMQHTARAMARVTEENGVRNWTISYLGHSYSINAIFNSDMAARMSAY